MRRGRNPFGVGDLVVRRTQGRPAAQANPGLGDAIPLGLGISWCGGPRVGLRASGQPWARGRNPVGIGGGLCGDKAGTALLRLGGLCGDKAGTALLRLGGLCGDEAGTALLRLGGVRGDRGGRRLLG
jgi:hypothetical protein